MIDKVLGNLIHMESYNVHIKQHPGTIPYSQTSHVFWKSDYFLGNLSKCFACESSTCFLSSPFVLEYYLQSSHLYKSPMFWLWWRCFICSSALMAFFLDCSSQELLVASARLHDFRFKMVGKQRVVSKWFVTLITFSDQNKSINNP